MPGSLYQKVLSGIEEGLGRKDLRAYRHATHVEGAYLFKDWLNESFRKYPSLRNIHSTGPALRKRLREIKEYSIDHLEELLPSAKEMLEFNDANVYMARDANIGNVERAYILESYYEWSTSGGFRFTF